jgi:hypothetical protein
MLTRRFRSSVYGDAGGRQAESPTDWLYLHANQFWFDDAKYLFLILGGAGLQTLYRPDGTVTAKFFAAGTPETDRIVTVLRNRGRQATQAEVMALKDGAGKRAAAPTPTVETAPTFTLPGAPAAPATAPAKKKRKVKPKPLAIYQRAWFPFAVGGGVLALLALFALSMRKRGAA